MATSSSLLVQTIQQHQLKHQKQRTADPKSNNNKSKTSSNVTSEGNSSVKITISNVALSLKSPSTIEHSNTFEQSFQTETSSDTNDHPDVGGRTHDNNDASHCSSIQEFNESSHISGIQSEKQRPTDGYDDSSINENCAHSEKIISKNNFSRKRDSKEKYKIKKQKSKTKLTSSALALLHEISIRGVSRKKLEQSSALSPSNDTSSTSRTDKHTHFRDRLSMIGGDSFKRKWQPNRKSPSSSKKDKNHQPNTSDQPSHGSVKNLRTDHIKDNKSTSSSFRRSPVPPDLFGDITTDEDESSKQSQLSSSGVSFADQSGKNLESVVTLNDWHYKEKAETRKKLKRPKLRSHTIPGSHFEHEIDTVQLIVATTNSTTASPTTSKSSQSSLKSSKSKNKDEKGDKKNIQSPKSKTNSLKNSTNVSSDTTTPTLSAIRQSLKRLKSHVTETTSESFSFDNIKGIVDENALQSNQENENDDENDNSNTKNPKNCICCYCIIL